MAAVISITGMLFDTARSLNSREILRLRSTSELLRLLSLKLNSITPWNVNKDNVYYNNGNVGVGTNNPQTKLQVVGDISANRFIGSGSLVTDLNPNNINGIIPQSRGGTGVSSLDPNYFDTSDNKLSLKLNSITPWNVFQDNLYYNTGNVAFFLIKNSIYYFLL